MAWQKVTVASLRRPGGNRIKCAKEIVAALTAAAAVILASGSVDPGTFHGY
jgi:hypothetical protein